MMKWSDERTIKLDENLLFGKGYDFDGLELMREELRSEYGSYLIWPTGICGAWSVYREEDGAFWFEVRETAKEAKSFVSDRMKWAREEMEGNDE